MNSEKRKVKSEKQTAPTYAAPTLTTCDLSAAQCLTSDLPMPACKGEPHDNEAGEQFTQSNIDTPTSTCLAASSPWEKKLRTSQQEPNHPTAKASYHTSKPRKVCLQRSAAKEDLYKGITLIESPIRRASLNCVSSLTLAKALPP